MKKINFDLTFSIEFDDILLLELFRQFFQIFHWYLKNFLHYFNIRLIAITLYLSHNHIIPIILDFFRIIAIFFSEKFFEEQKKENFSLLCSINSVPSCREGKLASGKVKIFFSVRKTVRQTNFPHFLLYT